MSSVHQWLIYRYAKNTISVVEMTQKMDLPGFRFHPTEEELLEFYLKHLIFGKRERFDVIGFLNIYLHDPRDLPGMAKVGEREWYFFVPRDRRHGNGGRPNRTTENGYWKATGSDRRILSLTNPKSLIGLRKTLVFYHGRAPRGTKTDWVMNEYRLPDHNCPLPKDIVLCKIYKKATSLKALELRAAKEDEMKSFFQPSSSSPPPSLDLDTLSFGSRNEDPNPIFPPTAASNYNIDEEEAEIMEEKKDEVVKVKDGQCSSMSIQIPVGLDKLTDLQVPKLNVDWTQDSSWIHFNSPWLQSLPTFADILNF